MVILFLTSTLPRFPQDSQPPFVLEQCLAWKQERPQDEIHILAPHDAGAAREEETGGVLIHRFRYFYPERLQALAYPSILPNIKRNPLLLAQIPLFFIAQYLAAKRLVAERGVELVYAHWVMPQGLIARRLSRKLGVRFALHNHSSDLSVLANAGRAGRALARSTIRASCALFCVNSRQREDTLRLFESSEQAAIHPKIRVIPMGVSPIKTPADTVSATDPGSARYAFSTISRLSRKKGIDLFIRAVEQLGRVGQAPRVGIAGDGEYAGELRRLVQGGNIEFVGFLSGEEKSRFFADSRFMVFCSVAVGGDVEGLPVALLEALCCGKVTLASRATNIELLPEWPGIKDDVVFLEDPTDVDAFAAALQHMLQLTPQDIAARAERLRRTMSRYRWDKLIREYTSCLDLTS